MTLVAKKKVKKWDEETYVKYTRNMITFFMNENIGCFKKNLVVLPQGSDSKKIAIIYKMLNIKKSLFPFPFLLLVNRSI